MKDIEAIISALSGRQANIMGHEEYFKSAILLPLVKCGDELYVLFEKRSRILCTQPGEVCFPGGGIEASEEPEFAAIRETCEELNLSAADIEIIAPLDIFVSPFGVIVYPFLAYIKNIDKNKIRANPGEVDYIFFVPLTYLLETRPLKSEILIKLGFPENFPYELIPNGRNYSYRSGKMLQHFFLWENEVIWGLTARILHHFLELIKEKL